MANVPIFPLPNVVLFPGVALPLHIFEPRYRVMIGDALDGDRRIAMVLLRPGWESDYEGRPPMFGVGCTGVIGDVTTLSDGRYHLVLHGLDRVRIAEVEHSGPYRRATVDPMPDPALDNPARDALRALRRRIAELTGLAAPEGRLASMPDTEFVHTLAHGLDFEPLERQALLECADLRQRAEALADLLEMRRLTGTTPPVSSRPH